MCNITVIVMFKITCIVGSARTNGSCAYIVDTFIRGIRENNADIYIKKYNVASSKINFCLGCKECYKNGKCVQTDDVEMIVDDILTSDVVLIASPSYWADVPGQLKTFFDRNTPYGNTNEKRLRTSKPGAKGISIAVRAGKSEKENSLILDYIEHYYGHLDIMPLFRFSICETDSLSDLKVKHSQEIERLYNIGKDIKSML